MTALEAYPFFGRKPRRFGEGEEAIPRKTRPSQGGSTHDHHSSGERRGTRWGHLSQTSWFSAQTRYDPDAAAGARTRPPVVTGGGAGTEEAR